MVSRTVNTYLLPYLDEGMIGLQISLLKENPAEYE